MNSLPAKQIEDWATLADDIEGTSEFVGDPRRNDPQEEALILLSDSFDLHAFRQYNLTTFSAAILTGSISDDTAERIRKLKPRRVVFIRGTAETAKTLEEAVRSFCFNEVIELSVVALDVENVKEHLETENGDVTLAAKIEIATKSGGLLDRTARSYDDLLSWLVTQPPALKTGYENLDKKIRIPVGAVTIVAGRPKHGKTTFLYNLMVQMIESGLYDGKKFYFFSYEENGHRIKLKILSRILEASDVSATDIAKKYGFTDVRTSEDLIQHYAMSRQEVPTFRIPAVDEAGLRLEELLPRFEVVNERLTVEALSEKIRQLNEREPIGAVFIDYMQRIPTATQLNSIRENMNTVSDVLKWCALNTGLSLIVGAQISRKATDNGGRPTQGDIKESGNLEEDANLVLGVFNQTQAEIDKGTSDAIKKAKPEQTIEVYTINSRDSEPSEATFTMTNRLFREG